jgi:hypothetical protein
VVRLGRRVRNFHCTSTRLSKVIWLFVIAGVVAACACWQQPRPTFLSPAQQFPALKQRLAVLRDLPFKRDVSFDRNEAQRNDIAIEKIRNDEYGRQSLFYLSHAYKRLGLLPDVADFADALTAYDRLKRIAFYDSRKETVGIAPEAVNIARALGEADFPDGELVPLSLGIMQALQTQHFRWQDRLSAIAFEDQKLALRAVAQGDALIAALTHNSSQAAGRARQLQLIARFTTELDKMASKLPRLLREKLVFPFREGSQFVLWAQAAAGWSGVNALFGAPPLSSAQILHPEKYFVKREDPVRIVPWGLLQRMNESAVIEQTLGEFLTRVLLTSSHSQAEAAEIASGWRGDQLSLFYQKGQAVTTWITLWRSEKDALAFYRAYEKSLQQRRLRLEPLAGPEGSAVKAESFAGHSLILQLRGSSVLFLDGLPSAEAANLSEDIWRDLEIVPEPTMIPFETASGPLQLSVSSR